MTAYFNGDDQQWNLFRDWTLEPAEKAQPCAYAQEFATWRDTVCQAALASTNLIVLNQIRLKVVNRYYEFFVSVPKAHQRCLGSRKHVCIFSVFIETMQLLKEHELRIDPPLLLEPPQPAL